MRIRGCERCDGGWVTVKAGYVERLAPWPAPLPADLAADPEMVAAHELLVEEVRVRRASLANTVYPCRECQPAAFFRWVGGHLERNHDRLACAECRELDSRRGSRKSEPRDLVRDGPTPVMSPPPRADIDGPADLVGF